MRRDCLTTLAIATMLLVGAATAEDALYVAPDGKDTNDGSAERPFATIERAQAAQLGLRHRSTGPHRGPLRQALLHGGVSKEADDGSLALFAR